MVDGEEICLVLLVEIPSLVVVEISTLGNQNMIDVQLAGEREALILYMLMGGCVYDMSYVCHM